MASSLAIYYTPMHFMWGVKSGATTDKTLLTQDTGHGQLDECRKVVHTSWIAFCIEKQ